MECSVVGGFQKRMLQMRMIKQGKGQAMLAGEEAMLPGFPTRAFSAFVFRSF
jgi:hypothetical protein